MCVLLTCIYTHTYTHTHSLSYTVRPSSLSSTVPITRDYLISHEQTKRKQYDDHSAATPVSPTPAAAVPAVPADFVVNLSPSHTKAPIKVAATAVAAGVKRHW